MLSRGSLKVVKVSMSRNHWKESRARALPADLVVVQASGHSMLQRTHAFILNYACPRLAKIYPRPHIHISKDDPVVR